VGVVHHDPRAVLFGKVHDVGQVRDVAAHGEHAVRYDEAAGVVRDLLERVFQALHVAVFVAEHAGVAELAAVVDAGVVFPVAQNVVAVAGHGADDAQVRLEAGGEGDDVAFAQEGFQLVFQLQVERERAV